MWIVKNRWSWASDGLETTRAPARSMPISTLDQSSVEEEDRFIIIVGIWFLSSCQPLQACASTVKYFPPILRQYLAIIPNDAILYHALEYGHYLSIWPYLDTAVQPSGSTKLYILSKLSTLQKPLVAPFIPTPVINWNLHMNTQAQWDEWVEDNGKQNPAQN